jgi:hypothetical protein
MLRRLRRLGVQSDAQILTPAEFAQIAAARQLDLIAQSADVDSDVHLSGEAEHDG